MVLAYLGHEERNPSLNIEITSETAWKREKQQERQDREEVHDTRGRLVKAICLEFS